MPTNNPIEAVFFDLDGTLIDTAPDLAAATNDVLIYRGFSRKPFEHIRPLISGGTKLIITGAFAIKDSDPKYKLYQQELLQAYQQRLMQKSHLFSGMKETLALLKKQNIPWGIVTNKPLWLAKPLLSYFNLNGACRCLVGKETLAYKKPHPMPLVYACQTLHVSPQNSVYIGDARTDIIAAKAAHMQSVAASYGYRFFDDHPKTWKADYIIETGDELRPWLEKRII